jgi:hypothetical protein
MSRLVRWTVRLLLVSALITAVVNVVFRLARPLRDPSSDQAPLAPIRTGSFDSWPEVPTAPGRERPAR